MNIKPIILICFLTLIAFNSTAAFTECESNQKSVEYNIIKTEHIILYSEDVLCKPLPVGSFTATKSFDENRYQLNWSKGSHDLWHVVSYEVRIDGDDNQVNTYAFDQTLPLSVTLPIPGPLQGLASFEIRACSALPGVDPVCGDWQATATQCDNWCTDNSYPAPLIAQLPALNESGDFEVSWSGGDYPQYELQKSVSGAAFETVYSGSDFSYSLGNQGNDIYAFQVRNRNGNIYSNFSPVEVTVVQLEIPTFNSLPTENTTGDYTVSWLPVNYDDDVVRYKLLESNDGGANWALISNVKSYSYEFNNQANNTTYLYKVKACRIEQNCSEFTQPISVDVNLEHPIFVSLPAQSITGDYTVSWSAVAYDDEEIKYQLQEKIDTGSWETKSNDRSYALDFVNQPIGSSYQYRIRACRAGNNCSDYEAGLTIVVNEIPALEFEVYVDNYSNRRYLSWSPQGDSGFITHYVVEASDANAPQTVYETYYVDGGSANHLAADYLPSEEPTLYRIKACVVDYCGEWTEKTTSDSIFDALTSVQNLTVNWNLADSENLKIKFDFSYPEDEFETVGGRPQSFKILSTFPQESGTFLVTTIEVPANDERLDTYSTDFIAREDVVGSSFNVLSCNALLGCSKPSNIAVGVPETDPTLPSPIWDDNGISYNNNSHIMTLSWSFGTQDYAEVDYIEIKETKPKVFADQTVSSAVNDEQIATLVFNTHDVLGPLELNRLGKGYYDYEIRACKRKEEGNDVCSEPALEEKNNKGASDHDAYVSRSEVTVNNLPNPVQYGWVETERNNSVVMLEQLYWSYDESVKPDYFLITTPENSLYPNYCTSKRAMHGVDGTFDGFETTTINSVKIPYADNINSSQWTTAVFCESLTTGADDSINRNFILKACKNGVGCSTGLGLDLRNGTPINNPPDVSATLQLPELNNSTSGPSDFNPGLWWHPDLGGTGWNFFWANGLRNSGNHNSYGEAYDLVGYWLAFGMNDKVWSPTWFEVRLKYVQEAGNGNKLYQGDIYSHTRTETSPNMYEFDSLDTGNITIKFDPSSSSQATLALNIDYSKGLFTPVEKGENILPYVSCADDNNQAACEGFIDGSLILEISDFSVTAINTTESGSNHYHTLNDTDHYMGLWQYGISDMNSPLSSAELSIANWIVGGVENNNYMYFDDAGFPVWVRSEAVCNDEEFQNFECDQPHPGYFDDYTTAEDLNSAAPSNLADYNVMIIPNGFNPIGQRPLGYTLTDEIVFVGKTGRQFEQDNDDMNFNQAEFWLDVYQNINTENGTRNIITNGRFGTGENNLVGFDKRANLHGIRFNINEFDSSVVECDLNNQPACNVFLTWFTDDNFGAENGATPEVKPMFKYEQQNYKDLSDLCDESQQAIPSNADDKYSTSKYKCIFKAPYNNGGEFTFQYHKKKYNLAGYIAIAQSEKLTIIGCSNPSGCSNEYAQPTEVDDPDLAENNLTIVHQPGDSPVPGSGGVSGGTATYNLPLMIPPGRNGMTPELSINYSSKGGDGLLGVGWSLSVGSSIYRCPQTVAQDGVSHAVDISDQDRLCLNGQRLMVTPANNNYWLNGANYRTEMDSFVKVEKVSNNEFIVYTKSGNIQTYQQLGHDQQSNWQIVKDQDSFGNTIVYNYANYGHNESLLTVIYYTGSNNFLGNRLIKFNYQDRLTAAERMAGDTPRFDVSYRAGEKTEQTQIISHIETYTDTTVLTRTYELDYQVSASNGDLLLSTVSEEVGSESRTLLSTNWSGENWSNKKWLDGVASNTKYDSIINDENNQILGERMKSLLGRASISNDFNGDGIKEYLAVDQSGENRSLFFFDDNNVIKARIKLPNVDSIGRDQTRYLGGSDLTLNGYTDLIDSDAIYSWKVNKKLPMSDSDDFSSYTYSEYFDEIPIQFVNPSNLFPNLPNGISVTPDPNKSQNFFIDYNQDGMTDLLQYVTPQYFGNGSSPIVNCYPGQVVTDTNGCVSNKAKIVLHLNATTPADCPEQGVCDVNFNPGTVLIDGLSPYTDLEGESDIWFYIWDEIIEFSDYNGDGYPDLHLNRFAKLSLYQRYDFRLTIISDSIIFTDGSTNTIDASAAGIKLTSLGLDTFTCQVRASDGSIQDEACNAINDVALYNKNYHFADVNQDGLKDFVYHDRGEDYIKSWKVRLNQGGNPNSGSPLFVDTFNSDINHVANTFSLNQPTECDKNSEGKYSSSSLARKCNPYFRSATEMTDLDADGVPELIIPDHKSTNKLNQNKADNLVFNYCSVFNYVGSQYTRRRIGGRNSGSPDALDFETYGERNIIPRYSAIEGNDDVPGSETNLMHEHLLERSSFYPYTAQSQSVIEYSQSFVDYVRSPNAVISYEPPIDPIYVDPQRRGAGLVPTFAYACAYNGNRNIGYEFQNDLFYAFDLYEDFGEMAALSDRSVYRYNAIKFELGADNQLNLKYSDSTGLYKPLFAGSVGDLSGDGITDSMSTIGCLFGSNFCKSLSGDVTDDGEIIEGTLTNYEVLVEDNVSWSVDSVKLKKFGTPLIGQNQLDMPNMLTAVIKPNTGQWVAWDYHPLTSDITGIRTSELPLYRLPERDNCISGSCPDGYIEEEGAKGTYIQFNSSMYVVSEMRQSNGLVNESDQDQFNTTQYGYEEAVYNLQGRGFQGFRKITVDNYPHVASDINRTRAVSTFRQVHPVAGKLERIENSAMVNYGLSNSLLMIQKTDFKWYEDQNFSNSGNSKVRHHPLEWSLSSSYDYNEDGTRLLQGSQTKLYDADECNGVSEAYDEFGNVVCAKEVNYDYLYVKEKSGNSLELKDLKTTTTQTTTNTYDTADIVGNDWWLDKLSTSSTELTITEAGSLQKPVEQTGSLSRSTKNYFFWKGGTDRELDCQYTVTGSAPTPISCSSSLTSTDSNRTKFDYDQWGNVTKVKITGSTGDFPNSGEQHRVTQTDYSLSNGYFANQVEQKLGAQSFFTTNSYDKKTGQLLTSRSPAGVQTNNSYDNYGFLQQSQVTHISSPTGQLEAPTQVVMRACGTSCVKQQKLVDDLIAELTPEVISNSGFFFQAERLSPQIHYVSQSLQPNSPVTTAWLDQNAQVVLSKTEHAGQDAYTLALTNPLGQNELSSQPFATNTNVEYVNHDNQVSRSFPYFTFSSYDERGRLADKKIDVGRLSEAQQSDDCVRTTTYSHLRGMTEISAGFSGADCANISADNNNLLMYRTYDSQGKLRQTVDDMKFITQYWYDSANNPSIITDAAGNNIVTVFDDMGRKTSVNDPNMGLKTFAYNSFGEVVYEQDAVQAEHPSDLANYTFYDQWGRVSTKYTNSYWSLDQLVPSSDSRAYFDRYDYDTGCGTFQSLLCGQYRQSNYDPFTETHVDFFYAAHAKQYSYDYFGRVINESIEMYGALGQYGVNKGLADPKLVTDYYYYENHNLLKQTIHNNIRGNGLSVVNYYDSYGNVIKQVENPTGDLLMEVDGWDLRGKPMDIILNNDTDMTIQHRYYSGTGQKLLIRNNKPGSDQYFYYNYDAWGNIHSQRLFDGTTEEFTYDSLQRLTKSEVFNGNNQSFGAINYGYDDTVGLGNLLVKSDYSTDQRYTEIGNAGPNAITSVILNSGGTLSYDYDENGNRITDVLTGSNQNGIQATYAYDAYNLLIGSERPLEMQNVSYRYGVDNLRYLKHENTFNLDENNNSRARREITLYAGPQFEQIIDTSNDHIETKFRLTDYLTITLNNASIQTRHFLQRDRLGSVTQILAADGALVSTKGYNAFGKPRNGDDWSPMTKPVLAFDDENSNLTADVTKRGFTDHEHLDAFELIHMNGRMYDFNNGRFLSVDPYIQGTTSQAINPYSYIHNNPLSGTDPTGYVIDTIWDAASIIYDVGKIAVGEITGDEELASEGYIDLAADTAAVLVPFVPAGATKVARAGKEGAEAVVDSSKGAKAAVENGGEKIAKDKPGPISETKAQNKVQTERKSGVPDENFKMGDNVKEQYKRPSQAGPTTEQKKSVQGKPCVDCGKVTKKQVADHKDPLVVEHYREGKVDVSKQRKVESVQPHCPKCSNQQGGQLGAFGKKMKKELKKKLEEEKEPE